MRRLLTSAVLLATLAGGTVTAAAGQPVRAPDEPDHRQDRSGRILDTPGSDGTNILLVGLDSRSGLTVEQRNRLHVGGVACDCTDVMMLAHLSEDEQRLSVVSVLRDSYVEYAAHDHPRHSGKINAAWQHGGGDLTRRTVEQATGVRIDHYMETDFQGFAGVIDRLGGATVCTRKMVYDRAAGLRLTPGTHRINGNKSVRYVRARHVNPPGDGGRVRRQQRLVSGLLDRLRHSGALDDPARAVATVGALHGLIRTDPGTTPAELAALALTVGRLRPEQTEFMNVPVADADHRVPGHGSTVLWERERSDALWSALRADRPITGDRRIQPTGATAVGVPLPAIQLRVSDAAIGFALLRMGFTVLSGEPRHTLPHDQDSTLIFYGPSAARHAEALHAALPEARLRMVRELGRTIEVQVGRGGRTVVPVVYDRTGFEGPPVTGDRLRCP
ncbi:LCP family protein [Streptomyces mesophilus]|uniref:LCP family protein n=1 Tax=Streptomyces mesophilus TaxID=1775132 RepID=UPI00331A6C8A